jgi:methylenetetrahydrofolate dehydrogenase (NADP+) / methenyltetrahydrofolate cyclohydrolase
MWKRKMKNVLRKRIKNKLNLLPDEEIKIKSNLIYKRLREVYEFYCAKTIGIYYSTPTEVKTYNIIRDLISQKNTVCLPKIHGKQMVFNKIAGEQDLVPGMFNIKEPKEYCQTVLPEKLDLIVVPCVGVDKQGNRIGRGGGYYDRYLKHVSNAFIICICYEKQLVPSIDFEKHDVPVDLVITEKKVLVTSKRYVQSKIIRGKMLSQKILNQAKIIIKRNNIKATLAVILIGNDPASHLYVKIKQKKCMEVGIDVLLISLDKKIFQEKVIDIVNEFNKNKRVTGILIQLPLPMHLNWKQTVDTIDPIKDVDGLTTFNRRQLLLGNEFLVCCTPKGILRLLELSNISLINKNICLVGNGFLVGSPLSMMLKNRNIHVTTCNKQTKKLQKKTSEADILICGAGAANFVNENFIKTGCVIIDAGASKWNKKIVGDVYFERVLHKVKKITPVPGGVGPMTIAMLIENVLEAHRHQAIFCKKESQYETQKNSCHCNI